MKSFGARALLVTAIVCSAFAACGGSIEQGENGPGGGSTHAGGGTDTNGDASTSASDASVTTTHLDADTGQFCINVDTASFDTSCNVDTDCIQINAGQICNDGHTCLCGGATINADGQDDYNALVEPLFPDGTACACPYLGQPHCIQSTCTFCPASYAGGSVPAGCPDAG
jgi:hypothetical protein